MAVSNCQDNIDFSEYIGEDQSISEVEQARDDFERIAEEVQRYLPGFEAPDVLDESNYEGENPIESGAWHKEGKIYIFQSEKQPMNRNSNAFPRYNNSIHEVGHAVGNYIKEEFTPSIGELVGAVGDELEEIDDSIIEDLFYLRSDEGLGSEHFAAAFHASFRNELGLDKSKAESDKEYAEVQQELEYTEENHFWDKEHENSLESFLRFTVEEAERRRNDVYDSLDIDKNAYPQI